MRSSRMPLLATKYFGTVPFADGDRFHFPFGLPAFENETSFVLIDLPGKQPLVFLQSTETPHLCFLALPVLVVDPHYELAVSFEDLEILELEPTRQPRIGSEVLVLSLLSMAESQPATANLLAPIVINLAHRRAVQAVRWDLAYSHRQSIHSLAGSHAC